ncbi:MAG: cytochrome c [Hyphomicrobiales bacterium]|nr:cytochrome c [Hyphomicrobiales bacterium]MBV9427172.1 cytochrome c [Bradyrhizobiaceae bacterium]
MLRRILLLVVVLIVIAGGAAAALAWRAAIDPVSRPAAASFDPALVKRGGELAAIGNCTTCHTAADGRAFAGGLAVATPFGTIYSTNITPDEQTGIGRWSEEAFRRALWEGVDRAGRHLYPAFPYDHFTLVNERDASALYAFLMTREPVAARAPANKLPFPLNFRPLLAGWKLLFLRTGRFQPDPNQNDEWNHGAYLVNGLAHCGACHTPRNALGATQRNRAFAGGLAEGWTAYALNADSPAPRPWDATALAFYLHNGWHPDHGVARGPMSEVTENLSTVPAGDVQAIATYIASIAGTRAAAHAPTRQSDGPGAAIYAAACATCHDAGRPPPFGGIDLALSTGPSGPTARNVIDVVLWGLPAQGEEHRPMMPGFAGTLNDRQLADLLAYIRARFSDKAAWSDIDKDIREARAGGARVYPAPSPPSAPTAPGQQEEARQ